MRTNRAMNMQRSGWSNKSFLQRTISWAAWKLGAYKNYIHEDFIDVNLIFILREIFDRSFREQNYKNYKRLQLLNMVKKTGVKMSEGTSMSSFNEVFIERIYSMFDDFVPGENDVVLDIGAQHGDYAILCSKFFHSKRVYSFEPLPGNVEIFKKNLQANNITNVDIFQTAVSSRNGLLKIYCEGDMVKKNQTGLEIEIEARTIDSLDLDSCSLIKVDVEGFELDVLHGAIRLIKRCKPKFIIEVHSLFLRKETENFLFQFGYKLLHEGRGTWVNENGMDYVQNLFFA